ncbi:unnamed protein product [Brassica oleracea var. botrytis]
MKLDVQTQAFSCLMNLAGNCSPSRQENKKSQESVSKALAMSTFMVIFLAPLFL